MTRRSLAGVAVLLLGLAVPAVAQQPPQPPRPPVQPGMPGMPGMGPRMGAGRAMPMMMPQVEMAMRLKEQLKLTDAQVSQLDALRKELVAQRQQQAHDMIDTQSRVAAGLLKGEEVRKQFEATRDARQKAAQDRRDRFEKILTPDQQTQLRQLVMRRMMRERMMQQRGMGRGYGQGGFAPGRGFGRQFGPGIGGRRPLPPGPGWDN